MSQRLLLDEHYSPKIAVALCERGIDAVAAAGHAQLGGAPDDVVLAWATREEYCLLTENVRDFMQLFSQALDRGSTPAGLAFASARRFPRSAGGVGRLVQALADLVKDDRLPEPGNIHWL